MSEGSIHFHQVACGPSVRLSGSNRTAQRREARGSYNGGMVFSSRPLRVNEGTKGHNRCYTYRVKFSYTNACKNLVIQSCAA